MLITAYGTSSLFGQMGNKIMWALGNAVFPDCHSLHVNSIEELRDAVLGRKLPNILLFSENPEHNLLNVTSRINPSVVVFYEDPSDIAGYMLRHRKVVWPAALQVACQNIATVAEVVVNPATLVIRRAPDLILGELIEQIATHFGLNLAPSHWQDIVTTLGLSDPARLHAPVEALMAELFDDYRPPAFGIYELTADVVHLMELVYGPLRQVFDLAPLSEIFWPVEVFFSQTQQKSISGVTSSPIDLLGPARYLYFGPYLCLPPGQWRLHAVFEVKENLSFNKIEVDICQGDGVLSYGLFDIPVRGNFEVLTEIEVKQPERPLEFRIFLKEGAIEGLFTLKSVSWTNVSRMPSASEAAPRKMLTSKAS